jgi:uncharacterized membrane protein
LDPGPILPYRRPTLGFAFLLSCALVLSGCRKEEVVPTTLRWDPDIRPIVERTCLPCHSRADTLKGPNAHGLNLERYERVRGRRRKILETVVVEQSMPGPNDAGIRLSEEEIRRIGEWIKGGAPR